MFERCNSLYYIDLYGIGTSKIQGQVDRDGVAYTTMRYMFKDTYRLTGTGSSTGVVSKPSTDPIKVIIGPDFTKVLNGFFRDRASTNENPTYVLKSDVDVYGGPTDYDLLMERPDQPSTFVRRL